MTPGPCHISWDMAGSQPQNSLWICHPKMPFGNFRGSRVAGTIVRSYTLRIPSLVRDRNSAPFSWHPYSPIRRNDTGFTDGVVCQSPEGCCCQERTEKCSMSLKTQYV